MKTKKSNKWSWAMITLTAMIVYVIAYVILKVDMKVLVELISQIFLIVSILTIFVLLFIGVLGWLTVDENSEKIEEEVEERK